MEFALLDGVDDSAAMLAIESLAFGSDLPGLVVSASSVRPMMNLSGKGTAKETRS